MARPARRRLAAVSLVSLSLIPTLAAAQPAPDASPPSGADIVVTANRTEQPIQRAGSAISVITAEEVEKASASDVGDLLRRVPGVTLTQSGGPGHVQTVRIRGGDVRHTLVLIDGIRVNDPTSTGREFDFSNLVLADVEGIEVLRGPQSALYGSEALGGVINIITKRGDGPPRGNLSVETGRYGTKEMKGGISGGDGKVDYSFGFAGYDTAGFSAFGYRIPRLRYLAPFGFEPDAARRAGVTGRIGVNVADGVRIEVGGSHNFNRAQYDAAFLPFPDTPSHAQSTLSNVYSRLIADAFGGVLRNTVTVFANRTDRTFNDTSFATGFLFCNNAFFPVTGLAACRTRSRFIGDRVGAEYQGELKLGPLGLLTFGAKTERETADSFSQGVVPNPSPLTRTIAAEQTTRSVFALHQITLFERLHLSLGGRVDDVVGPDRRTGDEEHEIDRFQTWRATAAYEIPETQTKLRASAGTGGKAPSLFQLYSPQFGTATLNSEHSFGVDAGIDQTLLDGRVKLSATIFHNRYRNLIDFNGDATRCRPDQPFGCFFNVARAQTKGSEYTADISLVPQFVRLRLTYTQLDAVDLQTNFKLARRPGKEGRVGLVLTPVPRLTIEPTIVFVGDRFDFPNEQGRLPSYARLDAYAEYRIDETFSVYARGENLTNARYEEVRNFGTPGRSLYAGLRATW